MDDNDLFQRGFFGPERRQARKPPGAPDRDAPAQRQLLYDLLGDLPDRFRPITARCLSEEERDGYILETLELDLSGVEAVPALFARPLGVTGPVPVVLFNHSHGGEYSVGKLEFVNGRSYLQSPPYAQALTAAGYAGLAIDHWGFGERSHTSESDLFKAMLWHGSTLWGMMVYDSLRAIDYLVTRRDVDADRLGTLGMSMGSTMAWWLAALDERVRVTVDLYCLTDFHALLEESGLGRHGIYYYVPGLLKHFTTASINALIAPRPHLALAGLEDALTPVAGLDRIEEELRSVYRSQGAPENFRLLRYNVGHEETAAGRKSILTFLKEYL